MGRYFVSLLLWGQNLEYQHLPIHDISWQKATVKSDIEEQKESGDLIIIFLQLRITFWDSSLIGNDIDVDHVGSWQRYFASDNRASINPTLEQPRLCGKYV